MTDRPIRFDVWLEPEVTELGLLIAGKPIVGPVRCGDVFTSLADSDDPIRLGVAEIQFYEHLVTEVDVAMGCRLLLIGEGVERVRKNSTLLGAGAQSSLL